MEKAALHRRAIAEREHWRQAAAVRDGDQPPRDPDAPNLVELRGAIRRYRTNDGGGFTKRLVNGRWAYFF
jgi:hypothetical protein